MQDFVKRHQNVALDVLALFRGGLPPSVALPALSEVASRATATAEELLKEIAEARAIEMEFGPLFGPTSESTGATTLLRGLPFRMVPVRAQFIVLPPFLRVAEDFVGLVDFLESTLRAGPVFGNVRVIFAR